MIYNFRQFQNSVVWNLLTSITSKSGHGFWIATDKNLHILCLCFKTIKNQDLKMANNISLNKTEYVWWYWSPPTIPLFQWLLIIWASETMLIKVILKPINVWSNAKIWTKISKFGQNIRISKFCKIDISHHHRLGAIANYARSGASEVPTPL